ncbi:hypothetical protein NMG60_11013598 [Bertholletia excelsa]
MDSRPAFSDSNDFSGSSCISCAPYAESLPSDFSSPADIAALQRLSHNLESIFGADFDFFADAKIAVAGGREVAVHRCILSARSQFFRSAFCGRNSGGDGSGVTLRIGDFAKQFIVSYEALVFVLAYLYTGKLRALPEGMCVCVDVECCHVACRPAVDFMVEVMYASFTFQISELVALYQRHLLQILDKIAADDILVILSLANVCGNACETLLVRCIELVVRSDLDITTLEKTLPLNIVEQIVESRKELDITTLETTLPVNIVKQIVDSPKSAGGFPDKHVKRIHRALDSDDVELVRMLLKEGHTSLDEAFALHYAVANCNAKTTTDLLDLSIADVNQRNPRGYTVLHVAAMRKEPKIIVSLLTKGAEPSDLTRDGRKALQIAKRLTKVADYNKSTENGKESPKERLCIEILEQAERREPLLGEASVSLAMAGDNLRMRLLYLENRVGLAKLLFPLEAQVAMDIAKVDGTSEFRFGSSVFPSVTQRTTVDLNDAPFKMKEEHLKRLRALSKTVELGKRFFPRCSDVLNKIMDTEDLSDLAHLENETPEDRQLKRQRFMEIQQVLTKAFTEDKEEFDRSNNLQSSSSSTSMAVGRPAGKLTFKK